MSEVVRPRVLFLSPHPDDESIYAGGTIAKEAQNADTYVAVITDGAKGKTTVYDMYGDPQLTKEGKIVSRPVEAHEVAGFVQQRKDEFTQAAGKLGIPPHNVIFLNVPDQGIDPNTIPKVKNLIKDINPHVVLSMSEAGTTRPSTPDHSWSSIVTFQAVRELLEEDLGPIELGMTTIIPNQPTLALRRYLTSTVPDIEKRFDKYAELDLPLGELVTVDVSTLKKIKREAMLAHTSQRFLIEFFLEGAGMAEVDKEYWYQRVGLSLGVPPRISEVSEAIEMQVDLLNSTPYPLPPEFYKAKDIDEPHFYESMKRRILDAQGVIYTAPTPPIEPEDPADFDRTAAM